MMTYTRVKVRHIFLFPSIQLTIPPIISLACELGAYGEDCSLECEDNCGGEGHFKSCDPVNGTCVCNSCWEGSDCSIDVAGADGYQCFLDYLESEDKVWQQDTRKESISLSLFLDRI